MQTPIITGTDILCKFQNETCVKSRQKFTNYNRHTNMKKEQPMMKWLDIEHKGNDVI